MIISFHATYKNSKLSDLEKLTVTSDDAYINLLKEGDVREFVILKTCHRVEIYMVLDNDTIVELLTKFAKKDNIHNTFFLFESDTIKHLIRVCAGMDSLIIGEQDIQRQVKEALTNSIKADSSGKILNYVFMKALNIAKKIRNDTKITNGIVSVPQSAIRVVDEWSMSHNIENVGIVGTGYVAKLLLKYLSEKSMKVTVFGRNTEKLLQLKHSYSVDVSNINKLPEGLCQLDVLISAVSVSEPILKRSEFKESKPLLILDLGNPRNIEFEKTEKYYDLDRLKLFVEKNLKVRKEELKKAEKIIDEKYPSIDKKLKDLETEEIIAQIYKDAEKIRTEEVLETIKILGNNKKEVIDQLTKSLMNRLLAEPVKNMRSGNLELLKVWYGAKNVSHNKNEKIARK